MELLKHISLGLGSIILQREYVSIYSSWTVHSDTLVLLFLGTGHSFPRPFEKPPRPHLAIPADESAVTVPFITSSLGSLEIGGPAKSPASQLPKPSPVLAATAPSTFWSCPLLLLCLFLCEWSSEVDHFVLIVYLICLHLSVGLHLHHSCLLRWGKYAKKPLLLS